MYSLLFGMANNFCWRSFLFLKAIWRQQVSSFFLSCQRDFRHGQDTISHRRSTGKRWFFLCSKCILHYHILSETLSLCDTFFDTFFQGLFWKLKIILGRGSIQLSMVALKFKPQLQIIKCNHPKYLLQNPGTITLFPCW